MPIRVVIVEDEKPARDRIRRLLAEHADFTVAGEASDAPSAVALIDSQRPELCFLDVQIPGGSGFDVLRRVKHVPRVIFVTAFDQYAVRAFEVNSIDYLLKPFDGKRFAAALERAREAVRKQAPPGDEIMHLLEEIRTGLQAPARLIATPTPAKGGPHAPRAAARTEAAQGAPGRIAGKRGGKIVLVEPADVLWFEAEETLVFARTREGRYLVSRTLSQLESDLERAGFFRSHRHYLVNLSHVGEILPGSEGHFRIVMRDEARSSVALSRRQARRLRALIPW